MSIVEESVAVRDVRYDTSPLGPGPNWVSHTEPVEGLGPFIRAVAHALMRERGMSESQAVATAVQAMKIWSTGRNPWSKNHAGHVTPKTQAKAQEALRHWESMKAKAHSGSRSAIELSSTRAGAVAGSYATGHPFEGNQHTGGLGTGQKAKQKKVKGQVAHDLATTKGVGSQPSVNAQAASMVATAQGPQTPVGKAATSAAASNAANASAAYYAQQAAQQQIQEDNAVASDTAAYNEAKDTVAQTAKQQQQNVAFTVARTHNTQSAQTNEQNQQQIQAVQLQAQTSDIQAQDKLKESQVALMGAMKAAGYRSQADWPDELLEQFLLETNSELETEAGVESGARDGFVGETGSSGAANFLPAGPSATQDKRITKRLKEPQTRPSDRNPDKVSSTHWFEGEDMQKCEKCGEPVTSPVHEHVDPHGAMMQTSATMTVAKSTSKTLREDQGFIDPPEDPDSPWHAFEGTDLTKCDVCAGAIQEPQHLKGDGQGGEVQEAAESAPGVPPVAIPDQAAIVRTSGRATYGMRSLDGPKEQLSISAIHEENLKNVHQVEEPLGLALKSHFEEQKRATINRLLGKRGGRMLKRAAQQMSDIRAERGDDGAGELDLDPSDVFDQSFWTAKTASVLEPHLQTASTLAHGAVKEQVNAPKKLEDSIALGATRADMTSRAHEAARAVTATTAHELTAALQQGVARGETRLELRARLEHVFEIAESARAQQISRTQTTGGYNQSGLTYARHLPEGLVGTKVWLARQDEETRPEHRMANGQPQDLDRPFVAGGVHLDYPGDTRAPLDEFVNCRCSCAYLPPGADLGPVSKAAAAYATAYIPPRES